MIVFNKLDRLPERLGAQQLEALRAGQPYALLSSRDPVAVAALRERILATVREHHRQREIFVPYELSALTSRIYAQCRVLKATSTPKGTQLRIEGERHVIDELVRAARSARS
jgi:50S ribosomal subunit-associated GTPase HflX